MTHIRVFTIDAENKEVRTFSAQLIGHFHYRNEEWVYRPKVNTDATYGEDLLTDILESLRACYYKEPKE